MLLSVPFVPISYTKRERLVYYSLMGRHRAFDETEALTAAMQTFWELGYEAASIDELTERTGLSRSSL